ncbi:hypothetical protein N9O22_00970 [Gammaproteobacteria bacterium]|nr:hypothetical protein [Gammaproteobacteria bacterium]
MKREDMNEDMNEDDNRSIKPTWSKWIPILDVMEIGHLTNPVRSNRTWFTTLGNVTGGIQGPVFREGNGKLSFDENGIYNLRISTSKGTVDYIGMSAGLGKHSISSRLSKHLIALLNLPDRHEYISSLREKYPDLNDLARQEIFQNQQFENYRAFRSFFSSENGESFYAKKFKFYNIFLKYPDLHEYESSLRFLKAFVEVRFFKMPGASRSAIKKCEASALGIYKYINEGRLPALNTIDESGGVSNGF